MNTEATPPSPRAIIEFKPFQTGLVLLLAGSHFVHDVFTAFLAPLLPLLIEKLGLSLFLAGSLAVVLNLPSLLNPFLGSWADRGHFRRYLVILGPGFSGVLMCLIGLAPSYTSLVVLLMTAGLSVASLHVAAPVLVSEVAGDRLGRGMAFFMVAGELARTVGPLIAVQLVSSYGLEGTWRGIPVALAATVMLWWRFRDVPEPMPACATRDGADLLRVPAEIQPTHELPDRTRWVILWDQSLHVHRPQQQLRAIDHLQPSLCRAFSLIAVITIVPFSRTRKAGKRRLVITHVYPAFSLASPLASDAQSGCFDPPPPTPAPRPAPSLAPALKATGKSHRTDGCHWLV